MTKAFIIMAASVSAVSGNVFFALLLVGVLSLRFGSVVFPCLVFCAVFSLYGGQYPMLQVFAFGLFLYMSTTLHRQFLFAAK